MANKEISEAKLKDLIERDKAKPVKKYIWRAEANKDKPPVPLCPKCEYLLADDDHFCSRCGQRVDVKTWALDK